MIIKKLGSVDLIELLKITLNEVKDGNVLGLKDEALMLQKIANSYGESLLNEQGWKFNNVAYVGFQKSNIRKTVMNTWDFAKDHTKTSIFNDEKDIIQELNKIRTKC